MATKNKTTVKKKTTKKKVTKAESLVAPLKEELAQTNECNSEQHCCQEPKSFLQKLKSWFLG
jgi:hypothetical protein